MLYSSSLVISVVQIFQVQSALAPGLGWVGLTLILDVPLSAWADGNLVELAGRLGNMVELPKSKSTPPRYTSRWDTLYESCRVEDRTSLWRSMDHWTPCSLMLSEADPSDYQKPSVIAEEYSLFPSASPDYGFLGLRSSPTSRAACQSGTEDDDDCCDSEAIINSRRSRLNGSRGGTEARQNEHKFLI